MRVKDIAAVVESFAPLSFQEDWDNSGLCVGSPEQEVHGVMLGFDCTPELVDEAVAAGADMIVTHHPLIYGGVKKILPEDPTGLTLIKAISAGVAVYAAHTNADKVIGGVSGAMARRLGLTGIEALDKSRPEAGFGAVGDLPRPMEAEEFIEYVKAAFGLKVLRSSRPLDIPISRVAMCGGSGSSFIQKAMEAGAQAYICGDVTYHRFTTPAGFMVLDIGHYEGEVEIVDILFSLITKKIPNFAVRISANLAASNQVHYY